MTEGTGSSDLRSTQKAWTGCGDNLMNANLTEDADLFRSSTCKIKSASDVVIKEENKLWTKVMKLK